MSASLIWLLLGALFLALEAFGAAGIGLLFAGVAAFIVSLLIEASLIPQDNLYWHLAVFLIGSSLLALLFWEKLKTWRSARGLKSYSNMVGDDATVLGTLTPGAIGSVRWSGTIMRAELAGSKPLPDSTVVVIVSVRGNVLTVKEKQEPL